MKTRKSRTGSAAVASLVLASLFMGAGPALARTGATTEIPVGEDGTVATDPSFEGPQVTEVRVINEGRFLEVYWDRYVDEEAAVSPSNITLTNGGTEIDLQPKPATGPTDTIFFDKDNEQIAATEANGMVRLPEDLHLASIAYTGTIDPAQPLTLTITGSNIEDADGRAAADATYTGVPKLDYYTRSVTTETGIAVKANPRVDPATLDIAAAQIDIELGEGDNDIAETMADFGCSLAVYASRENAYLVPEHRGGYDPEMYDVEGYGGSTWNGCVSSISERNVLRTRGNDNEFLNTAYPNENILIHEFGHAVRLVGIETQGDKSLSDEFYAVYANAYDTGLWPNTYAIGNSDEYFATLSAVWFDVMAEKPDWTDGVCSPINTRAELKEYDPMAYEFLAKVYPADLTLPALWDEPAPDEYHGDDGMLVNAANGRALALDGRAESGTSMTLTGPEDGTRWLLEDTTRTEAQGTDAYLLPGGPEDTTAPELSYSWQSPSRKLLAFEASDEGSGVASIEYRVNGGEWTVYSDEIGIRPHDVVEARATDHAGNTAPVLTVTRKGDR